MALEQIDQADAKGSRERLKHEHGRVGAAVLDQANGSLIDARLRGQLLLRQAMFASQALQIDRKSLYGL